MATQLSEQDPKLSEQDFTVFVAWVRPESCKFPFVFPFSNINLNWHLLQCTSYPCHAAFHPQIGYNSPLSC